ncbi:Adaptive-response sensory-kinase SasA [compost metagenome]
MKQAFQNLLLNGVTYSDDRKVEVTLGFPDQDTIKISFINTGKTLSKDENRFLFSHFFRGMNSKDKPGFGLGLVLAHRIIHLHSGSIQYDILREGLNRFVTELPVTKDGHA